METENNGETTIATPALLKVSKGISLPINKENTSPFIPEDSDFKNVNKIIEQTAIAVNANIPILFAGETGTGKTSLIRNLAAKTNNGFRRVNHNGGTTVDDIVGKILVNKEGTYWVDGVLLQAMKAGDWYVADEINASSAEILFVYHSLLDDDGYVVLQENGGEIVRPHPNFRFFATMNPSADYNGVKELNKALMSRFLVLKTDFPSPVIEAKIIAERNGIDLEIATKLVNFAVEIRAMHAKEKIQYVLSTRDLLMWGRMLSIYGKYMISAEMTIINKVGRDDKDAIKDLLALHFKVLDDVKPGEVAKEVPTEIPDQDPAMTYTTEEISKEANLINLIVDAKKQIKISSSKIRFLLDGSITGPILSVKAKKKLKEILKATETIDEMKTFQDTVNAINTF